MPDASTQAPSKLGAGRTASGPVIPVHTAELLKSPRDVGPAGKMTLTRETDPAG